MGKVQEFRIGESDHLVALRKQRKAKNREGKGWGIGIKLFIFIFLELLFYVSVLDVVETVNGDNILKRWKRAESLRTSPTRSFFRHIVNSHVASLNVKMINTFR
jgi:hypothetical protein